MSTKKRSRKKQFVVRYRSHSFIEVEVRASNKDDAITKADEIMASGDTDRQTLIEGDDGEVIDVREVIDA